MADFEAEGGDFHLRADSPAIKAGTHVMNVETDIDGDLRHFGEADMGADENCSVQPLFRRGDGNVDGKVDISDGVRCLGNLFLCACPLPCTGACDVNNDRSVNITDGIYILNWLFLGGPMPPPPGPFTWGPEPVTYLGCDSYPSC